MAINEINLDQKLSNLNKVAIQIGGKSTICRLMMNYMPILWGSSRSFGIFC